MLEFLSSLGLDLHSKDCFGRTALFFARDVAMALLALNNGSSPLDVDQFDRNALAQYAITLSDSEESARNLWNFVRNQGATTKVMVSSDVEFLDDHSISSPYRCSNSPARKVNLLYLAAAAHNPAWTTELLQEGMTFADSDPCSQPIDLVFESNFNAVTERESLEIAQSLLDRGSKLPQADALEQLLFHRNPISPDALSGLVRAALSRGYPNRPPKKDAWEFYRILFFSDDSVHVPNAVPLALLLLQNGFNPQLVDAQGHCGGDFLKNIKNPELVSELKKMGAGNCPRIK